MTFPAQPPDLRRLSFGRESFAFMCTLALLGSASYPVSVRRLDGFAPPLLSARILHVSGDPADFASGDLFLSG